MNLGKLVVGIGCAYELAALPERSPLPTLTTLTHRHRRFLIRCLVWLVWLISAAIHFHPWRHPPM